MHILIIPSEEFLPPQDHMVGIFQLHQAMALRQAGHTVRVLSIRQSYSIPMILKAIHLGTLQRPVNAAFTGMEFGDKWRLLWNKTFHPEKFITEEDVQGIPVYRVDGFYFFPPSKHRNHFGWLKAGKAVWNHYCRKHGKPDIIHAHNAVYAGMLASVVAGSNHPPYIITEHSSFIMRRLESVRIQSAIKSSYEAAAMVLPVTDELAQALKNIYGNGFSCRVLHNVLDPYVEQAPWTTPGDTSKKPFAFLSIASLIPRKRHSDLLEAFALAFRHNPEIRLKIGGDGELLDSLSAQVSQLGIGQQVEFAGKLDRGEVLRAIDESACLVLTSDNETFGVVLIEAFSRGKPVISSRCGGPQSVVLSDNGLLYDTGDIQGLASAMRHMVANHQLYDPDQIRRDALARYGSKPFSKQLESIYLEILS